MDKPDSELRPISAPSAGGPAGAAQSPAPAGTDRPLAPAGWPTVKAGPPGPGPQPGHPPYAPPRPTNTMAIIALVVALTSLGFCSLLGGVAVYLGNRARAEIRATGEDGDGMALAGVIIGWCGVAISVLSMLLLAGYLGFLLLVFGWLAIPVG